MTRPSCTCSAARVCRPCELIATRPDYVALWEVSAADVLLTVARIGKPEVRAVRAAIRDQPKACVYLGVKMEGEPCGSPLRQSQL